MSQTLDPLEQQVGGHLLEAISHFDQEGKRIASYISIVKASEVSYGNGKSFVLVYFAYRSHKVLLTNLYKKIVT